MATVFIQKRKSKETGKTKYQVQYKDPVTNKTCYYKTFHRSMDAQQSAQELRYQIDNGKLYEATRQKRKLNLLKFSEVAELAVTEWEKRVEQKDLGQATFDDYALRVDVLNRIFGGTLILNISKKALKDYRDKHFKEYSAVSSNRYLFIFKQVFKKGLKVGAIVEDPAAGIKYLSEKQHERNNYLMPGSLDKLVEASQEIKAKFYIRALIFLGAEHGASRQEALSLKWEDIDFDYEGVGLIRFFRTKNTHERTEFLMPRSRQALLEWKAHNKFMRHRKKSVVKDTQHVFTHLNGNRILRFDNAWRKACKIAGIDDFHYHDLRHTFCSNLMMSGSDLKTVKDMIGHRDIAMTDRYSHLSALHKRAVQLQLAAHYAKKD